MRPVEAAHVRANSPEHGKFQALAKKPDDKWTVPLCAKHHREAPDAQHQVGEAVFWRNVNVDPHRLALALFAAPDLERAEAIVRQASRLFPHG
jgi:hypothetical protein